LEAREPNPSWEVSSRSFTFAAWVPALGIDFARFLEASLRSRAALAAEILFLRKQLDF